TVFNKQGWNQAAQEVCCTHHHQACTNRTLHRQIANGNWREDRTDTANVERTAYGSTTNASREAFSEIGCVNRIWNTIQEAEDQHENANVIGGMHIHYDRNK